MRFFHFFVFVNLFVYTLFQRTYFILLIIARNWRDLYIWYVRASCDEFNSKPSFFDDVVWTNLKYFFTTCVVYILVFRS